MAEICPRCKLPVGGKTFGTEVDEYRSLLHNDWLAGSIFAFENPDLDIDYHHCPHGVDVHPARYYSWMGGVYYAKFRRIENPERVEKWLLDNNGR